MLAAASNLHAPPRRSGGFTEPQMKIGVATAVHEAFTHLVVGRGQCNVLLLLIAVLRPHVARLVLLPYSSGVYTNEM